MTTLAPGMDVVVRDDWPELDGPELDGPELDGPELDGPAHVRTPHYLRGRRGRVQRALGVFPDPGDLAFGREPAARALYHVLFAHAALWDGSGADEVLVEVYEHWLTPL